MRPAQNKRMRGRNGNNNNNNRRGPNPLTRSYESNGPDVKVRGTAAHIAEKYVQLARDAHVSGDPVAAESYLQHAEHYFRLIAAAQLAQNPPPRNFDGTPSIDTVSQSDEGEDEDFDGGVNDRFTYRPPQTLQVQSPTQPFAAEQSNPEFSAGEAGSEQPDIEQPSYGERQESRNYEGRNGNRFDNRNQNRFDNRRDNRNGQPRGDFQRDQRDNRGQDPRSQERFEGQRRDRAPRPDRTDQPRYDPPRQDRGFEPRGDRFQRSAPPEIAGVQPILPSFITAPVRPTNAVEVEIKERSSSEVERPEPAQEQLVAPVKAPRRRRRIVSAHEENEDKGSTADTPAAE